MMLPSDDVKSKKQGRGGERNGRSKLTAEQVEAIRSQYVKYKNNNRNSIQLAKEYGVASSTILRIVTGVTWKKKVETV